MSIQSALVGHRLTAEQRRDWRFALLLAGAVLMLVAYWMPFFPARITEATTRFSGGTTIQSSFPTLVSGQFFNQAHHPAKQELETVSIVVSPVDGFDASGWSWFFQVTHPAETLLQFISFFMCLILPIISIIVMLSLAGIGLFSAKGLPPTLIAPSIWLGVMAPLALVLAWFHQFDFSFQLLDLGKSQLSPAFGWWLAMIGAIVSLLGALGFRRETPHAVANWWVLVIIVAMTIWLLTRMKPQPFLDIWLFVSDGILVTLRICLTSFVFILVVSLLGGLGRISHNKIIYGISSLYVEVVRGIPLLVQLLFIWFALPQVFDSIGTALQDMSPRFAEMGTSLIDLRLNPFTAAVIGLTICYGAYGSEIFRAGISSIHHGQMEAARSLGMTYLQAMRHVILPQAVRVIMPPVGNEFVALLKDSSLVSVLAVSDLTRRGREYMARTFLSFDTWILVALCYLVLTLFSSRAVESIEKKMRFGQR